MKLHSVVGNALEKAYAKRIDEHLGELAYHFLEGGDKDKALDYFTKAGERAQKIHAFDEVSSHFQHALELLEEKEDNAEQKALVTERLGDLQWWTGKPDAGMEYWNKSLTLWNQLGNEKKAAQLHAKMASLLWNIGNREKASEHHRMALETLEKKPESPELAMLYEDIAHMLWRTGDTGSLSWAQKALELAERLSLHEVLVNCYNDLGTLSLKSGEFEKTLEYYEKGLKMALEDNFAGLAITLYNNLCNLYWGMGELEKVFETAQKGSELAKDTGSPYGLTWLNSVLAFCYIYMGDVQKALYILEDVLALAKRAKHAVQISGAKVGLGQCYQLLGEWDKSLQCLMEALQIAKEIGEYQFSGEAAFYLGELFMEMEDYEEARRYLMESRSIYEKSEETTFLLFQVLPTLSRLYLETGEVERAKELIDAIYEHPIKTKSRLAVATSEMLKAMLLREQENWEQSIQHFENSLQEFKSMNAQKWFAVPFAELLYEYGLTYKRRNGKGDKEKAHSLLNQALEIYEKIDAKKRIEKIKAKMKPLERQRS
jgi:tetratricopeptide (TPR) repeat protein